MIRDELSQAIAVANTINNEGTRVEMKVDAAVRALAQLLDQPGEPSAVAGDNPAADRVSVLEADVLELRSFLNLDRGSFRFEPVFLGPGANDVVLQMYGIEAASEAQVLADAAAVEAVLIGGDARQTAGYANHASNAPSTSLYDVMPERSKLERMTVADLKALAERHGITLADGNKGTIIDAMAGPKASS